MLTYYHCLEFTFVLTHIIKVTETLKEIQYKTYFVLHVILPQTFILSLEWGGIRLLPLIMA
jgi:hypothetical protein